MQGTAPVPEHVMAKVMFKEMLESVSVVSVTERQRQFGVEKADHAQTGQNEYHARTFQLLILDQLYLHKVSKVNFL